MRLRIGFFMAAVLWGLASSVVAQVSPASVVYSVGRREDIRTPAGSIDSLLLMRLQSASTGLGWASVCGWPMNDEIARKGFEIFVNDYRIAAPRAASMMVYKGAKTGSLEEYFMSSVGQMSRVQLSADAKRRACNRSLGNFDYYNAAVGKPDDRLSDIQKMLEKIDKRVGEGIKNQAGASILENTLLVAEVIATSDRCHGWPGKGDDVVSKTVADLKAANGLDNPVREQQVLKHIGATGRIYETYEALFKAVIAEKERERISAKTLPMRAMSCHSFNNSRVKLGVSWPAYPYAIPLTGEQTPYFERVSARRKAWRECAAKLPLDKDGYLKDNNSLAKCE